MKIWIFALILVFLSAMISAACIDGQVDINSASAEELDEITWIGPATAEKIIASRPFDSVDDLIEVSGIGEVKLQDIKSQDVACVDGEQEETIGEEDKKTITSSESNDTEKPTEENSVQEISNEEPETINLNPKVIKSDESRNLNDYARYGFVAFSILIVILFLIKNKEQKNEFG